jgi:hypothetical protein
MKYPTLNRSSRQSSYNNLDVEHDEKNIATPNCSRDTPLSSTTTMISRLKSRVSFNRRQRTTTTAPEQPVSNKKSGEVVSKSNVSNMNAKSDTTSPVLPSSQTWSTTSGYSSSSSSSSSSELGLQPNEFVEGSSQQQEQQHQKQELPRSYVDAILKVYGTRRSSSSSSSSSSSLSSSLNMTDDDVDLYRDVFQISSEASNREIQMAFIREGRYILVTTNNENNNDNNNDKFEHNGSTSSTSSTSSTELLDDRETKLKFIALSMAHEILSTPSLKEIYDTQRQQSGGGLSKSDSTTEAKAITFKSNHNHPQFKIREKEKQGSPVKVLRASSYNTKIGRDNNNIEKSSPSSSSSSSSLLLSNGIARSNTGLSTLASSSSSSIRWKDHVEEIKFIGHPNEHEKWIRKAAKSEEKQKQKQENKTDRTSTSSSSSSSSSQCCTPTIPEKLESRLVSMDADGDDDRLFVKDFWDTLEDSLDVILNVGGCCKSQI